MGKPIKNTDVMVKRVDGLCSKYEMSLNSVDVSSKIHRNDDSTIYEATTRITIYCGVLQKLIYGSTFEEAFEELKEELKKKFGF